MILCRKARRKSGGLGTAKQVGAGAARCIALFCSDFFPVAIGIIYQEK